MASTYTTNKKLEQPANNDYVGNWNLPVNADWSTIDTCFGGYQVLNPTGLSGTVALTSSTSGTQPYTTTAQWQSPNIVIGTSLTGVATLTASINYQLPSGIGGIWSIYNNTTGAFTVTFSSAGGGSSERHLGRAKGQRGAKRQPGGGAIRSGGAPGMKASSLTRWRRRGVDARSFCV